MRVLMITQKLDPADPLLGFTVGWVKALASRVETLDVMCLEHPPVNAPFLGDLPANVRTLSMGKERGYGRIRIALAFYRLLWASRAQVWFSHMIPRYAWMAAPAAILKRAQLLLWYTHRADNRELHWAAAVVRHIATAAPESFPFAHRKVQALGHGVDGRFFAPEPGIRPDEPPLIVMVGRLSPIKHQETLILAAAALADLHFRVAFIGQALPPAAESADSLRAPGGEFGVGERTLWAGGLPPEGVRDMYRRAAVAVNLSPEGLFDKAALEAMLCGVPAITSSKAFDGLYGDARDMLRVEHPADVDGLTARLRVLLNMSAAARYALADPIRTRVAQAHSLDGLMDRLVALMGG